MGGQLVLGALFFGLWTKDGPSTTNQGPRTSELLPEIAAQPSVLERELFDAGEQDPVQAILAAEVLLAVLEQPPRQRQQQPFLREQDQSSGSGRSVRAQVQMGLEPPVDVA